MKKHLIVLKERFCGKKLLDSGADGRILKVIKDMYRKAKSCVKTGNVCSDNFFFVIQAFAKGENCHVYFLPSI